MLIVLSPAKTLDFTTPLTTTRYSQPEFLKASRVLVRQLQGKSPQQLAELMHMSGKLGELNFQRYLDWHTPFTPDNARPAIFAFKGDVYLGLKADQFNDADLDYAQSHLRILSGLYGMLRPLDLMQPYRLEMGTSLGNPKGDDLYSYWKPQLTRHLAKALRQQPSPLLVNLASNEYFQALDAGKLKARIITPQFKDFSNGKYRFLSFFAKQARGLMAAWLIRQRVDDPARIPLFNVSGYRYSENDSTPDAPVFLRRPARPRKQAA